ncbi:MAG: glycosyltransferase family 39 protein [bacterium]
MVVKALSKLKLESRHLLLCYLTAVLVRLIFVGIFPGTNYFGGVSERCLDVAKNVVDGKGYVFYVNVAPFGQPDHFVYEPFIDKPIGYPTFLAVIFFITGYSPIAAQIIQLLLVSLGVIVIYKLVLLFGVERKYALSAAMLAALWPNHARFEVTLLPEAVMPLLLISSCYLIVRSIKALQSGSSSKRSNWSLWSAGLILGLGVLSRPDIMFLPIFMFAGIALVDGLKFTFKIMLPVFIVFYGIIGLHTIRNYSLTNEIIPLGYSNGTVLWQGISQFGDTLGTVYSDYRIAHHEGYPSILYPNGIARDRKRFTEAVSIIKEHPLFYLSLIPRRIPLLLVPRGLLVQDNPLPRTSDKEDFPQHFAKGFASELTESPVRASVKIFSALSGVLLFISALIGFVKFRKSIKLLYLPALMSVYFIAVLLPINAEARYFFPAVVFLFPLAILAFKQKKLQSRPLSLTKLAKNTQN